MQSLRALQAKGTQIAQEFERQHKALLDGREVTAVEGDDDALYEQIAAVFLKLTLDFPATKNGSKFINCRFILEPQLTVRLVDFGKTYVEEVKGNLFLKETGLALSIEPLKNKRFGPITKSPIPLIITNMRLHTSGIEQPKSPRKPQDKKIAAIASIVDTRPPSKHMKWTVVADVSFGSYKKKDLTLQMESLGTEETTSLVLPLPHFEADILPDGSVTLSNGAHFSMEKVLGKGNPVCWISQTHSEELDIKVVLNSLC